MTEDATPFAVGDGFDEFFRAEYPKLLALGRALAPIAAADLAQEALIRACRNWDRVADYDIPAAWVRRVMLRLVADHHRSGRRRDRAVGRLALVEGAAHRGGDERWDGPITPANEAWFDAVRSLPRRQAEVVALHYIDQFPIAEVAIVLDVAPGTVKSSLSKARRKLAVALGDESNTSAPAAGKDRS